MISHQTNSEKNLEQYIIGLTGNICSGKSKAAEYFKELGAYVLDMDELVHELYQKNTILKYKICKNFGLRILNKKLEVDRKKLGIIVFSDKSKMKKLEEITWPYVRKESKKRIKDKKGIIILEAAMLHESRIYKKMDKNVLVLATEQEQIERLIKRNNITKEEALKRISLQASPIDKVFQSDYVVFNTGSLDDLKENVKRTFASILLDYLEKKNLSTLE